MVSCMYVYYFGCSVAHAVSLNLDQPVTSVGDTCFLMFEDAGDYECLK
jgi:hypothetical protein